jgi:transcriptional regulator with XRE-family HTH domain
MDPHDFTPFLNERLKEKGMSLKKLADVSGVPLNHLTNLANGDYDRLPPEPYLRGYFQIIGSVLEFDAAAAWERFKRGVSVTTSGATDELPRNRFAPRSFTTFVWIVIAAGIAFAYLVTRFSSIVGRPTVTVIIPSEALTRTTEPFITIAGKVLNGDSLTVNGETVLLAPDGAWEKRLSLQPGLNTVTVLSTKFLGGTSNAVRQVMYEELRPATDTVQIPDDHAPNSGGP